MADDSLFARIRACVLGNESLAMLVVRPAHATGCLDSDATADGVEAREAEALISIAHPDFRDRLAAEARDGD